MNNWRLFFPQKTNAETYQTSKNEIFISAALFDGRGWMRNIRLWINYRQLRLILKLNMNPHNKNKNKKIYFKSKLDTSTSPDSKLWNRNQVLHMQNTGVRGSGWRKWSRVTGAVYKTIIIISAGTQISLCNRTPNSMRCTDTSLIKTW